MSEKLEKLLNELAEGTAEPVSPGLAENIKHRIPHSLALHRRGVGTVNIIIDLRINRLAAAATIIIMMILLAKFLGGQSMTGDSIYRDSKVLVKHLLAGESAARSDVLVDMSKLLVQQGKDVVYYGDGVDAEDSNAVLMQWKLDNGNYMVILGDGRAKTISAEELIEIQARMLQRKTR